MEENGVNEKAPFIPTDLDELDDLLGRAEAVVAMEDIVRGPYGPEVIAMRHDVDNAISPAVEMAQWEAERGYRSTYFILHTAPYWQEKGTLRSALEVIAECGHEIGFHLNAITQAITTHRDPLAIIAEAVGELREYGHNVHGVVAHGDNACYQHRFVNDELFKESPRPDWGKPDRYVAGVKLRPVTRSAFGFDYDPNWLPRGDYLSDSGGAWSKPYEEVAARFPEETGQLHMLVHPCWWSNAFSRVTV